MFSAPRVFFPYWSLSLSASLRCSCFLSAGVFLEMEEFYSFKTERISVWGLLSFWAPHPVSRISLSYFDSLKSISCLCSLCVYPKGFPCFPLCAFLSQCRVLSLTMVFLYGCLLVCLSLFLSPHPSPCHSVFLTLSLHWSFSAFIGIICFLS